MPVMKRVAETHYDLISMFIMIIKKKSESDHNTTTINNDMKTNGTTNDHL